MLGVNRTVSATHYHKTLVSTAVQLFYITLLSSKGKGNHFDLHEKLFVIIRTLEFADDWSSNCLV